MSAYFQRGGSEITPQTKYLDLTILLPHFVYRLVAQALIHTLVQLLNKLLNVRLKQTQTRQTLLFRKRF